MSCPLFYTFWYDLHPDHVHLSCSADVKEMFSSSFLFYKMQFLVLLRLIFYFNLFVSMLIRNFMICYFYQTFYFFLLPLHRRSSWGDIRHEKRFSSKISLKQKLDYIRSFFFIATSQYRIILTFFSFI